MNEQQKASLYQLVKIARESCAGSDVQDINHVLLNIRYAIVRAKCVNAPQTIIDNLVKAGAIMLTATEYKDRLTPDTILCAILNEQLGD
jgi:hypothetical protein